jgi:anti-anti-sigma factor
VLRLASAWASGPGAQFLHATVQRRHWAAGCRRGDDMQIRERLGDDATIVELTGDGVGSEPSILKEKILSVLHRGDRRIVLDMTHLRSMDSTCLAEIVVSYKAIVAAGGVLKMAAPNPHVRRLMQVTRVDTFIQVYDTDADAMASFDVKGSRTS